MVIVERCLYVWTHLGHTCHTSAMLWRLMLWPVLSILSRHKNSLIVATVYKNKSDCTFLLPVAFIKIAFPLAFLSLKVGLHVLHRNACSWGTVLLGAIALEELPNEAKSSGSGRYRGLHDLVCHIGAAFRAHRASRWRRRRAISAVYSQGQLSLTETLELCRFHGLKEAA